MTSRYQSPPILKSIERLLVDIEQAVRTFTRAFRHDLGADLRRQAMQVFRLANRAYRDREAQARWVGDLVWAIDDLRQYLQTAKLLGATKSFRQFEHLARQVEQIGMQAGGWKRTLSPNAQSAHAAGDAQRGKKLSTRAASAGAHA